MVPASHLNSEHSSVIIISDFRIKVRIGCNKPEQARKQLVSTNIKVYFSKPLQAMHTDNLNDTCCYMAIIKCIESVASNAKCCLLERLAFLVHERINQLLLAQQMKPSCIEVKVQKVRSILTNLKGGAAFVYRK